MTVIDSSAREGDEFMSLSTLHIDEPLTWRGGQAQVLNLLRGLKGASIRAELVTQPGSVLGEKAGAFGINIHPLRMRGEADLLAARRINRIIRSGGFKIVHMHTAHAHMIGCLACALNPDPICVVSRRVDFPVKKHPLSLSGIKYKFRVDHYIAISAAIRDVLISGGVKPEKISVVHSGVEPPKAPESPPDIRAEFGLSPTSKVIGTVGALVDHKGYRYLIEAAPTVLKMFPEAKFLIIGDGELRGELEELASQQRVENDVIFAGFRPGARALLEQFDIFAASSHMEGLNTSIIDAIMMGKPVVATSAGGIPEIIEHEKNGLLVPPRNPRALAEAIVDLLAHPEKAEKLALAGRKTATSRFTADHMAQGVIAVYKELLRNRCKN